MKQYIALFGLLLLLPLCAAAQEESASTTEADTSVLPENTIMIGEEVVSYDAAYGDESEQLFFVYASETDETELLVASYHDRDEDGKPDVWLRYVDGTVTLEAYDLDADGASDAFIELAPNGDVVAITGPMSEQLQASDGLPFVPDVPQVSDDVNTSELIGDLSDISIEEKDYSWVLFFILLIAGGLLYFFWRRQQ